MPRKPKITRMPPEVRAYIERLLREDRLTLDEMIAELAGKFPNQTPSRSTLHRYQSAQKKVTERIRAQDTAARAIVSELGENPDEKSGQMLVQVVTALATDVALRATESDETSIDEVRKLARAVKETVSARATSLKERQAIEQAARERLVREQREKLDALGKSGKVDKSVLDAVIKAAYNL